MTRSDVQAVVCAVPEDTAAVAASFAGRLGAGDVVFLEGPLGAGKTTFVRAMARALGADERDVVSPTYAMVQELPLDGGVLVHLDLYRLEQPEDALGLGLDELPANAIIAVEWPERGGRLLGRPDWRVRIEPLQQSRRISIEAVAPASV